jgi:uncharacterized protein DUF6629
MCFSAATSFGLAAVLVPAGAYCVRSALRKNHAWLCLALIPLVFAVQQVFEGLVWAGLDRDNRDGARSAALVFLYFALAFWPFWLPFCAFLSADRGGSKWLLGFFTLLGLVGGLMLYLPIVLNPDSLIPEAVHHSIHYDITRSAAFRVMPRVWWQGIYVLIVIAPLLIAPSRGFIVFGIAILVSAAVSHVFYGYAFASVWCFFAALLSLSLCLSFRRQPMPGGASALQSAARG